MKWHALASSLVLACAVVPDVAAASDLQPAPSADLVSACGSSGAPLSIGRCATPPPELRSRMPMPEFLFGDDPSPADCDADSTNPSTDYDPGDARLIGVWVHIIQNALGEGNVPDAQAHAQAAILAEDFRAIAGTNGAGGADAALYFRVVGITRNTNDVWFGDGGAYYNTLAVNPFEFLNIYSNDAGGNLGYVPALPTDNIPGFVGSPQDRVVVYWESLGRDSPLPPYDQGRTATHEVGHYMGLEHTFGGGCGATGLPAGCYSTGDLLCDTNAESSPAFGCQPTRDSCTGASFPGLDPVENYMDYSDDLCMERFTVEQNRRMRCALQHYRTTLGEPVLFYDGFELGTINGLNPWSSSVL